LGNQIEDTYGAGGGNRTHTSIRKADFMSNNESSK
jgi:hypothetical protein